MTNRPPFVTIGPLEYDLNEIEHQFYMFDHRCVGCVALVCTFAADAGVMGTVTLSGRPLEGCFWLPLNLPTVGEHLLLVVPVRGLVAHGSSYTLRLEGFKAADGAAIEPLELPLATKPRPVQNPAYAAHDETALEAARQGMVLLKNEGGVLPLPPSSVLNLFGEGVANFRMGATGAGRINPRFALGLREAVEQTSQFALNDELDALYAVPSGAAPSAEVLARARQQCDTAVIVITRGTGENIDNAPLPGEYYLSAEEEAMIAAVCTVFDKTAVVLNTGYPIDMRWTQRYGIKALVYAGLAGQAGAQALCEILDGRISPSGRLPDTWAWDYYDIPASANFHNRKAGEKPIIADDEVWADTCYEEGIYVGYRYFESFGKEVAFPFGHGLSYTTFETTASAPEDRGDGVRITATVTNSGTRPGRQAVLAYAALPGTRQQQPARQLVAFGKTDLLAPGQSETLVLDIPIKYLATYDAAQGAWLLEQGTTGFFVGGSVREAQPCGALERAEEKLLKRVKHRLPCPVDFVEMSPTGKNWPTGNLTRIREGARALGDVTPRSWPAPPAPAEAKPAQRITYAMLRANPSLLDTFVTQMSTDELARLNMMYGHGWSMDAKGEAGRMAPLEGYGIPEYVCADGNCGVNIFKPNIGMPTSVVLCATFNPQLARQVGRVIGEEAAENGVQMILAAAMNLHRNPLCGRHAEYFSEDPLLAGVMAAAQVQGLHDAGVSDSVKHVAANNCETARKRNHSLIGERALREVYLRAFEVLCDHVKPDTIMAGYNALNGCMCGSDPVLIEGIFREEFGFDGFAMTDWSSYDTVDMVAAANAGISWLTPGENDGSRVAVLLQAVKDGSLPRARLQENAKRVFAIMLRRLA